MRVYEVIESIRGVNEIDKRSIQPNEALGLFLLSLKEEEGGEYSRLIQSRLASFVRHAPMLSERDVWTGLWRSEGIIRRDAMKPDSLTFLRDCQPKGDKRAEGGSEVSWQRPSDQEIWKRHCLELKAKAYLQYLEAFVPADEDDRPLSFSKFRFKKYKRSSSLLKREEAGLFMRFGNLPETLKRWG